MSETEGLEPRESMDVDVVIVGAGPAGLAAAIRLKQIDPDCAVVVLEKGAEVGAHILSGAVVDPSGLDALLPDWRESTDHPLTTPVSGDEFLMLSERGSRRFPAALMPGLMSNQGNFVVSLGKVCRWLGEKAEALGVEIYPGFAATELVYGDDGAVHGVATGDMGLDADGRPGPNFQRGMELLGKYVLLGEGARGSLSQEAIARFGLDADREPQKFGLGLKELWEVPAEQHRPGLAQHFFGWPLDNATGGGGFLYHYEDNKVAVGLVVHLNYANPYLSPFNEFQRFKTHPTIRAVLEGGRRVSYGARAISEGGWQSVPKMSFPGGALLGCAAGLVNVPRIKGSHNAVHSGMLAAETVAGALAAGRAHDEPAAIEQTWREGPIGRDLKPVRNVKPLWSRYGTVLGVGLGGLDMWSQSLVGVSPFGTLGHGKSDAAATGPAADHAPIAYPRPDGVISFDKMSSVFLSNTRHDENQPVHLRVADMELQKTSEHDVYGGPSAHYCPAGVYEWDETGSEPRFVINAANCVHCKTCDIKDPNRNITWVPPQGGEGPVYEEM